MAGLLSKAAENLEKNGSSETIRSKVEEIIQDNT